MGQSYLKILVIIVIVTTFTSCSKEDLMFIKPESQERISPNSKVVSLMKGVVSSDGSYDNVVDRSSHLTIILPISVVSNNVAISLAKPSDFLKIHEIHNQSTQDRDFVTIDFPIRVILPNHKIRSVGSQSALNNLVERLNKDEGLPISVKCLDIVYPVTFSVINQESGVIDTNVIKNDEELYVFLDNLDVNDLVGIEFPIFFELVDGSQYEATNFVELELVLENYRESCLAGGSDESENELDDDEEAENAEDEDEQDNQDEDGENEDDKEDNDEDDEENGNEDDNDEDDDEDDDDDDEDDDDDDEDDD